MFYVLLLSILKVKSLKWKNKFYYAYNYEVLAKYIIPILHI